MGRALGCETFCCRLVVRFAPSRSDVAGKSCIDKTCDALRVRLPLSLGALVLAAGFRTRAHEDPSDRGEVAPGVRSLCRQLEEAASRFVMLQAMRDPRREIEKVLEHPPEFSLRNLT